MNMASSEAEDINTILDNCLLLEKQREPAWIPRIKVRRTIIKAWDIKPSSGARIIDIGCGQGESSVSLAYFLGKEVDLHKLVHIQLTSPSRSRLSHPRD